MAFDCGSAVRRLRWIVMLAMPLAACVTLQQSPTEAGKALGALGSRDAAMRQLAQDTRDVTARLAGLETREKEAVIALLTLSNAVAAYERAGGRLDEVPLQDYYASLADLSRNYRTPGKFQAVILACFDASVSCAGAKKSCLDEGGGEDECDGSPKVVEACGAEAACMYDAFIDLDRAMPDILDGRDPWPPQPFPY